MAGAIYLSGIAGVGKSSAIEAIRRSSKWPTEVFSYSERLGEYLGRPHGELRQQSSRVVGRLAVEAVDHQLAEFVGRHRSSSLVVIDSHAVTDEDFGQRVLPFDPEVLGSLKLDAIILLVAEPSGIVERVREDPRGRPTRTLAQTDRAQRLQESVAVGYSTTAGVPLYVLEADGPAEQVQAAIVDAVDRATRT